MLEVQALCSKMLGPIDLSVAAGELVCLAGPSGSGKTLLLRALADLDPHEGRVRLGELEQAAIPAHRWRSRVGLMTAAPVWWGERVRDCFPPFSGGERTAARQEPGREILGLGELGFDEDVLDWEHERLSSGEGQRLALIRLLTLGPRLLLLDEPSANLDEDNTRRIEDLVRRYCAEQEAACILVSHDTAQQERLGGRLLLLEAGRFRG